MIRMNQIYRDTLAIYNFPTLIAFFTDSFGCVEYFTLGLNFAADSVLIKIESFRTFDTDSIFKLFTAEVIVDECEQVFIVDEVLRKCE